MRRVFLLLALPLAACAVGSNAPVDTDGDGLTDDWEAGQGLSSELADSDGDGYTDYEEVFAYTDALDGEDHPYEGGWARSPWPAEELEAAEQGYEVGQVMPNFSLLDQFGEPVSLWSFYGNVLLIKDAALWCGPCRDSEQEAEGRYQNYKEQGFFQMTLVGENDSGADPTQDDLVRWAELPDEDVTFPVLGDPGWGVGGRLDTDGGIPTFSLIGRDMTLRTRDAWPDDATIEQLLAEDVPAVDWPLPGEGDTGEPGDGEDGGTEDPVEQPTGVTPFSGAGNSDAVGEAIPVPYGGGACDAAGGRGSLLGLLLGLGGLALARRRA